LLAIFWLLALGPGPFFTDAATTPRKPVLTEYRGTAITDDYQWLENGTNPAVARWTEAQDKRTRSWLDRTLTRTWVTEQLSRLLSEGMTNYFAPATGRERLFFLKTLPTGEQPVLVSLRSMTNAASEQLILDPKTLDPTGRTSIDWFVPSPDGRRVAVSLSRDGTEQGTLQIVETDGGAMLMDQLPGVQGPTAGGSAAWNADG